MASTDESEADIEMKIHKTLYSINDITVKIKKELEMINEFVKKDGHLHTVAKAANEVLSKKAQEMGLNVAEITDQSKQKGRSDSTLITASIVTEKMDQLMNNV
ncbi:uncharacterized protein LOC109857869 [Pseudomyrmex gracilis]|uniref:uncharacterized protein LOC109857869 n=1 Tax=Pseudomyrmex gracilis TaxID=219809 RepID=UPI0009951EEA|nr:uncharacterized protein LOC109857869 [Pseudomyrmex gracilis]